MSQIQEDERRLTTQKTPNDQRKGKMVLTLCQRLDQHYNVYPHAVIPFAASYAIACHQAVRMFPGHLVDAEHVLLKYAVLRYDGLCVWSSIKADDWGRILKEDGEEIGVFRSESNHTMMPFNPSQPPQLTLLATSIYLSWEYDQNVLVCTDSYEELLNSAFEMCKDHVLGTKFISEIKMREKETNQLIGNSGALRLLLIISEQPLRINFTC